MTEKSTLKNPKSQTKSPKQSTINFLLSFASVYQVANPRTTQPVCDFILN